MSEQVSNFYKKFNWYDNPYDNRGLEYYNIAKKNMSFLLKHEWFKRILEQKKTVKILEICAGVSFGGVAMAGTLQVNGIETELVLSDIRENTLNIAKTFAETELNNTNIETRVIDAKNINIKDKKFDICLMYGLSMPHFNPWEFVELTKSVQELLVEEGMFIIHDTDRRLLEFIKRDYEKISYAGEKDHKQMINIHKGYDLVKGTITRDYYKLEDSSPPFSTESYFWGLAEAGAILWTAFCDVDFLNVGDDKFISIAKKNQKIMQDRGGKNLPEILKYNR